MRSEGRVVMAAPNRSALAVGCGAIGAHASTCAEGVATDDGSAIISRSRSVGTGPGSWAAWCVVCLSGAAAPAGDGTSLWVYQNECPER